MRRCGGAVRQKTMHQRQRSRSLWFQPPQETRLPRQRCHRRAASRRKTPCRRRLRRSPRRKTGPRLRRCRRGAGQGLRVKRVPARLQRCRSRSGGWSQQVKRRPKAPRQPRRTPLQPTRSYPNAAPMPRQSEAHQCQRLATLWRLPAPLLEPQRRVARLERGTLQQTRSRCTRHCCRRRRAGSGIGEQRRKAGSGNFFGRRSRRIRPNSELPLSISTERR
mmetsp:Transcript_58352/g.162638  ORF Transcript_58352/g.162638 Transcript_58352/m.162638 type:complete len:220 (-) Transcript_58352:1666-2325(-)